MLLAARLAQVLFQLLIGLGAAPFLGRLPDKTRRAFLRWWARALLGALGVRLRLTGRMVQEPALIVANHISWLDVIALLAAEPAVFICKSEVAAWPGIGWLLKRAGTIFIHRGSIRDVWRVNLALRARFAARQSVAAFPEGTTTLGDELLAFRPALFQPAVERGLPIQPVALAYSSPAAAYVGEMSFVASLVAICGARGLQARMSVLPPLPGGLTRRQAAEAAHGAILEALTSGAVRTGIATIEGFFRTAPRPLDAACAAFSRTSRATPGSASPPNLHARRGW